MKIRLRNLVAVDVSQTDDQAVKLRFVTASKDEAVVVVPHELLREFMDDLLSLSSEEENPVTNGKEPDIEGAMRGVLSKGVTRAA
jgi:hypothetical protein